MTSMNVQVCLKTAACDKVTSKFEMTVNGGDTVGSVKEKIAASNLIAFPDNTLMFGETKMDDGSCLESYGIKEASCLDFVVQASEESIVTQLKDLLKSRDLTSDELGLLYCYKHGVSINQALKTIGIDMKLADFIKNQKSIILEGGKISLVRDDTALQPLSVAKQLEQVLRENGPTMDVTSLCSKFVQKFHVSVASIVQMRPAEFLSQSPEFALLGNGLVTLKEFEAKEKAKVEARTARSKSPALRRGAAPAGEAPRSRSTERMARPARTPVALQREQDKNEEMYQELHTKISSRSFNSRIAQSLSTIASVVEEKCFLNVVRVDRGGSIAKGTAIAGCADGELVFQIKGLPHDSQQRWLPALLKAVQSTLEHHLAHGEASDIRCTEDSVRMNVKDTVTVDLRFSPAFESYQDAVQSLGALGPSARKPFEASFVKERTQFVAKQPGNVKVTIRLLKWWRDQQSWSCSLTRPSDYLLELVAIYASQQVGKTDQAQSIANCMSLMARLDQMRVIWSNNYERSDIWAPLLMQKPLLMDPVNPFTNVVDPQEFDPRELTSLAATTHFFF